MSAWLDALIGRIFASGVEIPLTRGINFVGGLRATRNTTTNIIEADVKDNALTPVMLGSVASDIAVPFVIRKTYTAGTPGTADDVTVLASASYPLEILRTWTNTTSAIAATSVQLRSLAGGVGNGYSGPMSTAATDGEALETDEPTTRAVPAGGGIFLRRSNRGVAGTVYLLVVRT